MRQKKRKITEKETRHQRRHDSLHCPRVKCNKFWQKDTLVKPNKWQTGLFQPSKVSVNFSELKTRAFNRKFEIKPIPILLNISLTTNNHFWYCCPFFASDLMHNSTGYVIKQLVHAFSCALSSYGVRGTVGCALSSYGALKKLELPSALASATLTLLSCSPNFPRAP